MSLAVLPCFTLGKIEIGENFPVGVAHKNEGFFSFASIMFMKSAKRKEMKEMFYMAFDEEDRRGKLKRIYLSHHKDVFAKAYSVLRNHHDAEDAAQEAWASIAKNIDSLPCDDANALRATVITVAKYKAIDLFRRRCRKEEMTEDLEAADHETPVSETVFSEICEKETAMVLAVCLRELDDKYTDVLRLYYLQGNSTREIARLFSMSVKTVETRLARGRALLCKKLKEKGYAGA